VLVSALVLTAVVAIALAVALAVLLPGAGFIGAIVVVVVGIAVILWLLGAAGSRGVPSELAPDTKEREFFGPGGPDDPDRPVA
jgi:hypothetical protein